MITSLGLKTNERSKKKKSRYAINNISMKDISKIIKDFEKLHYKGYVRKRPKHELTDSYFYLERQFDICMMRADELNLHVNPVRMEMTSMKKIPISHAFYYEDRKQKRILADKNLSQVCSTGKSK